MCDIDRADQGNLNNKEQTSFISTFSAIFSKPVCSFPPNIVTLFVWFFGFLEEQGKDVNHDETREGERVVREEIARRPGLPTAQPVPCAEFF